jgi:hypothetical protein
VRVTAESLDARRALKPGYVEFAVGGNAGHDSAQSLAMEEVGLRDSRNELGLSGKAVDWRLNLQ